MWAAAMRCAGICCQRRSRGTGMFPMLCTPIITSYNIIQIHRRAPPSTPDRPSIQYLILKNNRQMISEFLLKGIDNIFQDRLAVSRQQTKSIFTRETIKRDLSTVIRTKDSNTNPAVSPAKKSNIQKNIRDIQQEFGTSVVADEPQEISKSRLKAYLENDRENKLKSVIRRADGKSKSPIRGTANPYPQAVNTMPQMYEPQRFQPQNPPYQPPAPYSRYQQPSSQYLQAPQHQPQPYNIPEPPEQSVASKYYPGRRSMNPLSYAPTTSTSTNYDMRVSPSPNRVGRSPHHYRMF